MTIQFGKLVRDKIVDIITSKGDRCTWHVADGLEYDKMLRAKLHEEVEEVLADPCASEFADVLEVIDAMAQVQGLTFEDVLKAKQERAERRGGLTKRIILDSADEQK